MTTPARRMTQAGAQPLVGEGARVDRLALLPLQPHEAADGQPVEGVDRLLAAVEDARAGREADAELVDPHAAAAGHDEVAELVDQHEGTRMASRRTMLIEPSRISGDHSTGIAGSVGAPPPRRAPPRRGRSAPRRRARRCPSPKRSTARLDQARDAREASVPSRKRSTATSSAAMSAAVARGPARPAARAMRRAGKRASSGASKVIGVVERGRGAAPGRTCDAGTSGRTGWGCACQGVRAGP